MAPHLAGPVAAAPELQRLVAKGPGCLPDAVVVDVGAVQRWVVEAHVAHDVWAEIAAAANRGGREVLWIVAPTSVPHAATSSDALQPLVPYLQALGPTVCVSNQPAPGILRKVRSGRPAVVVTAGIEGHQYELHVLAGAVASVLDISSGESWTRDHAKRECARPDALPLLFALCGSVVGLEPIVRSAASASNFERMRDALRNGEGILGSALPPSIKQRLLEQSVEVGQRLRLLGGRAELDPAAAAAVDAWLAPGGHAIEVAGDPYGAHVVAAVERPDDADWKFRRVIVKPWGKTAVEARGHEDCRNLLAALPASARQHWTAPRALDLLSTMVDSGLELPNKVFDPGIATFVADPREERFDLGVFGPAVLVLPESEREWITDVTRETEPPEDVTWIANALEEIERSTIALLVKFGQNVFHSREIETLLPELARVERRGGAWVEPPDPFGSWAVMADVIDADLQHHLTELACLPPDIDALRAEPAELVRALRRVCGDIPADYYPRGRVPYHAMLDRYYALGPLGLLTAAGTRVPPSLAAVRSLGSPSGLRSWVATLDSRGRLRGMFVPQRTGRWGYRRHALQNIPKHVALATELRSGLAAPPGYRLLAADWKAFELRLMAERSGDPNLGTACSHTDAYEYLRQQLGGAYSRDQVKVATLAIGYGRTRHGLVTAAAGMRRMDAERLYRQLSGQMQIALQFAEGAAQTYGSQGSVTSPGGWTRRDLERDETATNTLIQGFGADLQRHVLRELAARLPQYGAFVVYIVHDEFVVACPDNDDVARQVRVVLEQTMEQAGTSSGLASGKVPLFVKITEGQTWRELV